MISKMGWILIPALVFISCSPTKRPINFGSDVCIYCKMTISDRRFGAEIVTAKGKVHTFDSVECLAAYQIKHSESPETIHSMWVINFNRPAELIDTATATYQFSEMIKSPMGLHLIAFEGAENAIPDKTGKILSWSEVIELVTERWFSKTGLSRQISLSRKYDAV